MLAIGLAEAAGESEVAACLRKVPPKPDGGTGSLTKRGTRVTKCDTKQSLTATAEVKTLFQGQIG